MSKIKKILPEIRFPEFEKSGEWEQKELSQLGNLINGLTYSPKDVREKGLLVLRSSNVQNGVIDFNDCVFVRPDIKGANLSEPNDILICVRNGSKRLIGKNALIPIDVPLTTHGAFMTMFRAKYPEFVFQLFQSEAYDKQVKSDLGATINSINGKNFLKYEFLVPRNPKEQQKIASCLSSLDELIATHNDKLDTLKDHKKGLMQNLFPQEGQKVPNYRFPEFVDDGEWVEKSLDKTCEVNPKVGELPDEFIYVDLESVSKGSLQKKRIIKKKDAPSRAQRLLQAKDVIYQMVRPYQKNNFYFNKSDNHSYVASTGYAQLRAFDSSLFLFQLIHTDKFVSNVLEKCTGSNYPAINSTALKQIEVQIPPTKDEQQKVASCLSVLDETITVQAEKITQLQQHKKGLMQGLFPKLSEL